MRVKTIILFSLILIINNNLSGVVKIDSKLDNNLFISRVVFKELDYSLCIVDWLDISNSNLNADFCFENHFINAGRIRKMGVWRELSSPLGASVNSDLFNEAIGFEKDFSFYKSGLSGLSLKLNKGSGVSVLFDDNLWLGANYTFVRDPLSVTVLASVLKSDIPSGDGWTSTYSFIPETNFAHIGLHSVLEWKQFKLDYLGAFSGSQVYKAGSYNRLFVGLFSDFVNIKGLGGIISPNFVNTDGKLSIGRYLLGFWIQIYIFRNWETILKCDYGEERLPVLPAVSIPTSGSSSMKLKFDNSILFCRFEFGQKYNFDSYGTLFVENSFEGKIGLSGRFPTYFLSGVSSDFNTITERKLEFSTGYNGRKTDVAIIIKHSEEIFKSVPQNTLRIRIDQESGTGSIYFKIEMGNKWILKNLTLGFKTEIVD